MALNTFSWDVWVTFGMWCGAGWAAGSVVAQAGGMKVLGVWLWAGRGRWLSPSLLNSPQQLSLQSWDWCGMSDVGSVSLI